jgi:hypothetical protein
MTPQLKRIRELEKENKTLKEIIIEKELEQTKRRTAKRNLPWRKKKRNHKSLCFQGLKLDVSLAIIKISKHQYYYQFKNTKQGLSPSLSSVYIGLDGVEILNTEIIL